MSTGLDSRAVVAEPVGRRRPLTGPVPWSFGYLVCAVAATAMVVTLLVGAGAPRAAVPGLPDPGPITGWGLPGTRLAAEIAGILAIGGLLTASLLLTGRAGALTVSGSAFARAASAASAAVAATAVIQAQLTISDFLGVPPLRLFSGSDLSRSIVSTMQGRALLLQGGLAALVAVAGLRVRSRRAAGLLLVPATLALAAPSLAGHASATSHPVFAMSALLLHIAAASLWVGGLVGLALVVRGSQGDMSRAVDRFSKLALGCIIGVLVSGSIVAWSQVGSPAALLGTSYGLLVLAKASALVLLAGAGSRHRRHSIPALVRGGKVTFVRLAGAEIVLMAATIGLAVGLARTPIH